MIKDPPDQEGFSTDAPTLVRMVSGSGRMIGAILGKQYKIVEPIGEGGIGVVYRARQLTVDRDVAVKVLKKQFANDDLAVRRFENEAQAIGRLRHPNTLRLYDVQRTTDGELYIVTELLTGSPLSDVLRNFGRLSIERSVRTFDEICRSLAEAHSVNIVHRDLKPANIFLDRIGNEDVVKVLDFGIAKILQAAANITRAGAVPGTPQYMSPEQASAGKIDHRADIYSLGCILYAMIAGKPPFDGPSVIDILSKQITEKPPRFSQSAPAITVPAELERLVLWMLEKAPEDRPQSIDELRRYLPSILAQVTQVTPLLVPRADTTLGTSIDTLPPQRSPIAELAPSDKAPSQLIVDQHRAASRGWRWFSVITGSIGLIIGVVIGYANIPTTVMVPAQPQKPVETTPIEMPPPVEVRVIKQATIATDPPGARVIAPNGTELGVTPLEVTLAGSSTYLVMRDDGTNAKVTLSEDGDAGRRVHVALPVVEPETVEEQPKPVPVHDKKQLRKVDKKKKR
jgi:serine/threonine-protein kinase